MFVTGTATRWVSMYSDPEELSSSCREPGSSFLKDDWTRSFGSTMESSDLVDKLPVCFR